jgi:hypothetical protein
VAGHVGMLGSSGLGGSWIGVKKHAGVFRSDLDSLPVGRGCDILLGGGFLTTEAEGMPDLTSLLTLSTIS